MQAKPKTFEPVLISSRSNNFRVWYHPEDYWQIDIYGNEWWLYFGSASTLVQAFEQVAVALQSSGNFSRGQKPHFPLP